MLPAKLIAPLAFIALLFVPICRAEEADDIRDKGIAALKDSQANPRAIVDAARFFVKAAELYNAAGNEEKNVEMNSFLYWCKKKMTMEDIDAFTKGGEAAVSTKLAAVEKQAPKIDEAQKYLDRAEQYASKNPTEHLLIAIRFYEVADRFKGADASLKAQDRSLKEQLLATAAPAKPVVAASTLPVPNPEPAPQSAGTRPIPSADDIKLAEKLIKDLFKDDYAKTDAPGQIALVQKLVQQSDENKGEAATMYALLHEARDRAIAAGDTTLALDAQKRLRDAFKFDFASMLLDLRKLEPTTKAAGPATVLAALYALGADDALASGNFEQAVRYNSRAEDLIPLIKDAALKDHLKVEIPRVLALKVASPAALAAQKTLTAKPDDPEANLIAGKFVLQKGDAQTAFPLLAKGKDDTLKSLAKRELAPSAEVAEQVAVGDGWFDLSEKEGNAYLKVRMKERAATWYTNALPALSGLGKLKIETRLKTLPKVAAVERPAVAKVAATQAAPAGTVRTLPKLKVIKAVYGNEETERDETAFWKSALEAGPYAFLYGFEHKPDPAPGKPKYVKADILVDGVPQTFKVPFAGVLVWPWLKDGVAYPETAFKIHLAMFGSHRFVDVTKKLQQLIPNPSTTCEVKNLTDSDPAPFTHKILVVFYSVDRRFYMKIFSENKLVQLPSSLRAQHPEIAWISKNASGTLSSYWPEIPSILPGLFNGEGGGHKKIANDIDDMACSTTVETDPSLVIDLKQEYELGFIEIIPRRTQLERAFPLTLYRGSSSDGPWTEIWKTEEKLPEYEAAINGRAQFLKLVRTGRNHFDLFSIRVFGKENRVGNVPKAPKSPTSKGEPSTEFNWADLATFTVDKNPEIPISFLPLIEGEGRGTTDKGTTWGKIPAWLAGRVYSFNTLRGGKKDPSLSATLVFEVQKEGVVLMACSPRFSRPNGKNQEYKTKEDLIAEGWKEIGLLPMTPDSGFPLFTRQCIKGETLTIRTEKYVSPILIK